MGSSEAARLHRKTTRNTKGGSASEPLGTHLVVDRHRRLENRRGATQWTGRNSPTHKANTHARRAAVTACANRGRAVPTYDKETIGGRGHATTYLECLARRSLIGLKEKKQRNVESGFFSFLSLLQLSGQLRFSGRIDMSEQSGAQRAACSCVLQIGAAVMWL